MIERVRPQSERSATSLRDSRPPWGPEARGSYATAITCIDGRIHATLTQWIKEATGVNHVDMLTEPGPERVLTQAWNRTLDLKEKARLSAQAHSSTIIVLGSHYDCAANPVAFAEQQQQIAKAVQVMHDWGLFAYVIGAWVNEWWQVTAVTEIERILRTP